MSEPAAAALEVDALIVLREKIFRFSTVSMSATDKKSLQTDILDTIATREMAPIYEYVCPILGIPVDHSKLQGLKEQNAKKLGEFAAKLKDAEENLGETEVRESMLAKADYLASIGDMPAALQAYKETEAKTVALGQKMDMVFSILRLGMFYQDWPMVKQRITDAKKMFEEGADWERKNRLKIYESLLLIVQRRLKDAAKLLLDSIATFTTTELMTYDRCIFYCVVTAIISLPRIDLKRKVVDSPEILTAIEKLGALGPLLNSLYTCDYKVFFESLAAFADDLHADVYLCPHYRYYLREIRAIAYAQYLESYKSVKLDAFAAALGVSTDFLDRELADFIVAGRLHCKIDKVAGVVETTRPDAKNALYQQCVRQGDHLLNRIQKLGKVAEID